MEFRCVPTAASTAPTASSASPPAPPSSPSAIAHVDQICGREECTVRVLSTLSLRNAPMLPILLVVFSK